MGLLTKGTPLSWEETKALSRHVRKHGILQFINLYHRFKDRKGDELKWGDEVEYMIVKFDEEKKTARLSLRGAEILEELQNETRYLTLSGEESHSSWHPEYAAYMLEGIPAQPYGGLLVDLNEVESNMKYRRKQASRLMHPEEKLMTLTSFQEFTDPMCKPYPLSGTSNSSFFPDEAVFAQHPRFKILVANILRRRGEKVITNVPIYKEVDTPSTFMGDFSKLGKAALPDHISLDDTSFGWGCCCLQLTFQASNIDEARRLYDNLAPICPIMLAITAASPFCQGFITDVDCRWKIISELSDCRTKGERGLKSLEPGEQLIPKSRFDSISTYISSQGERFNDISLAYDEAVYQQLIDAGLDHILSKHFAHLFLQDPLCLYSEKVHQDDTNDTYHFENIHSTNWQSVRFKPPIPNTQTGWRVEFRPCEVQITDFENAAIACFMVLLTRVILSYQLDFIIPISKVDENMLNAQKRNAIKTEKFWFRKDISTIIFPTEVSHQYSVFPSDSSYESSSSSEQLCLMTVDEIVNGKTGEFPGLIPIITKYLTGKEVDADTNCTIQRYLHLIQQRASGRVMTTAQWLRSFVTSHQDYKKDSVISERINYDLLKTIDDIQNGSILCPELLGDPVYSKTQDSVPHTIITGD